MLEFIGRKKRLQNKTHFVVECIGQIRGREKINTAIAVMERIADTPNRKVLEQRFDEVINSIQFAEINSLNIHSIKLHNIQSMELAPDMDGNPAMIVWDKIFGYSRLYKFPLTKGFEIAVCNVFLRSLNLGVDIHFETFCQYGQLIWECFDLLQKRQSTSGV